MVQNFIKAKGFAVGVQAYLSNIDSPNTLDIFLKQNKTQISEYARIIVNHMATAQYNAKVKTEVYNFPELLTQALDHNWE